MPKSAFTTPIQPEYIRLPASGADEAYTGLNRSAPKRLVQPREENNFNPPVQSKLFNPAGGKRWVRLVLYRSLLEYLDKLPSGYPAKRPKVTTPRRKARKEPAHA